MIASLTGRIVDKTAVGLLLDVHGVGFALAASTHTLATLPAQGDTATLLTYLHVREDELALFGFGTAQERSLFGDLITVSGVGPKVALAALSTLPTAALIDAIASEDITLVSSIPGVGKKTAQRICLELKDRVAAGLSGAADTRSGPVGANEARDALLSMGFSASEIVTALKGYEGPSDDTQALMRHALRRLGGAA
jgi:Holliday junction DNA helicase RuvA